MNFGKHMVISCLALAPSFANAEVTRINLGPSIQINTPCSKVELKQIYNVATQTAPQEIIAYVDVDAPSVNSFRVELEQCAALATAAAAGLIAIAENPPAASPLFKESFYACAKTKASALKLVSVELGIKSFCRWSDKDDSPPQPPSVVSDPVFNAEFYIKTQEDVAKALKGDIGKIVEQWRIYGISEGRRGSRAFDPRFYLENHPDLAAAYGGNHYYQAILHWLAYGQTEGRASSYEFDPQYYLSQYPELRKAYGDNGFAAATIHWVTFGVKEGRRGSAKFDVTWYLSNNAALRNMFGIRGYEAAFDHWVRVGRAEGRKGIQ